MTRVLNSFKVRSGSKILDYRLGNNFNLDEVKSFFQKNYNVEKLWNGARHVLGVLVKNNQTYFLKLSTSKGISVVTKNEYGWNNFFNDNYSGDNFCVPKNYDSGIYRKKYYYLITDYFKWKSLCEIREFYENTSALIAYMPLIIKLSELIQRLPGASDDFQSRFKNKAKAWFDDIPSDISKKYGIKILLECVEDGVVKLSSKPRHGDFTPWHMIKLPNKKLGLIDGEHFLRSGIEGYDICYFIQRVFSVLKNPCIARDIYSELLHRGYEKDKLQIVLAARAIGGFLDESLSEKPDYNFAENFKDWVMSI